MDSHRSSFECGFVDFVMECSYTECKGQILRSTPNTAPLICGACNTQPEGLLTMA